MYTLRVLFEKQDAVKFISHLDLNRAIYRALVRSKLPLWFTEGFNPRPNVVFVAPLSVGHIGLGEIFDVKLFEQIDNEKALSSLQAAFPPGLKPVKILDSEFKLTKIAEAQFEICLDFSDCDAKVKLTEILEQDNLIVLKRTKKGDLKELNISPYLKDINITVGDGWNISLKLTLPCAGDIVINPEYVVKAISDKGLDSSFYQITRLNFITENLN